MRSLIVAAYTIKKEGLFNLKIAGQVPDYNNQLRMGVIQSEPMLRDILEKGVATITHEDRDRIVNRYVAIHAATVRDYSMIFKVISIFIGVGLLLLWRFYELKKYSQKLLHLSETDLLTQLYNRTKTDQVLYDSIEDAKRTDEPFSVLLLDIDLFKAINDTFGHPIGDKVLIEMAKLLKESIRHSDTLGRWGGEEFLILCPNSTQEEALSVAERIQETLRKGIFPTNQHHTVSIGIATFRSEDTPHTLISHADDALYQAKHKGRNTICFAS